MGKLFKTFLVVTVLCAMGYLTVFALVMSNPSGAFGLSFLMMPLSWGVLIGIVGSVVTWIVKK